MSLSTPMMILPTVSIALTLHYDMQFNLGYTGKAFSVLQFSVSYFFFSLLFHMYVPTNVMLVTFFVPMQSMFQLLRVYT